MLYNALIVVIICILLLFLFWKFQKETLTDFQPTLVFFSAEWCGYCQKFKPTWYQLVKLAREGKLLTNKSKTKINLMTIDANESGPYGVYSYPTLRLYYTKPHTLNNKYITYKGDRSIDDIKKFIQNI